MPDEKKQGRNTPEELRLGKNLAVREECRHDLSGSRLVLTALKTPREDGSRYAVAWLAPWQKTLTEHTLFATEDEARIFFNEARVKAPPEQASLSRDWQQAAVYKWESDNICKGTPQLNEKQMRQVIKQLCKDFNIAALDLQYREPRKGAKFNTSWYLDGTLVIRHKEFETILHEITHAIDQKVNGNDWAAHGPSFVRTLIALASKYHWSDAEELEKSAQEAGILIAPAAAVPALRHI